MTPMSKLSRSFQVGRGSRRGSLWRYLGWFVLLFIGVSVLAHVLLMSWWCVLYLRPQDSLIDCPSGMLLALLVYGPIPLWSLYMGAALAAFVICVMWWLLSRRA